MYLTKIQLDEVCFYLPLATQLPEMHPFSDIQYRLVLILYRYYALLVLFSLDVLHTL